MLVDLCDGLLFGDQYGSLPARVIALHGWGRSRGDWAPTLDGLDALALDLPGFGRSPEPTASWGTAEYAERVADCVEGERLVLVGHSFGGRVAVQFAAAHPERVEALILTGVPLLHRTHRKVAPPVGYRLIRLAARTGLVSDSAMESARRRYGSADYRTAQGVMRSVLVASVNEEYEHQLLVIHERGIPTFLVWGEGDEAVPLEVAHRAHDLLGATAQMDVVSGSSHLLDARLATALRGRIEQVLDGHLREDLR